MKILYWDELVPQKNYLMHHCDTGETKLCVSFNGSKQCVDIWPHGNFEESSAKDFQDWVFQEIEVPSRSDWIFATVKRDAE